MLFGRKPYFVAYDSSFRDSVFTDGEGSVNHMSLFLVNIRFQIAAICFFAIILFSYIRMQKMASWSTRVFNCMLVGASVNLVFDIITVYTVTHMDTVPAWLNDLCHRIFVLSLVSVMLALYFYIEAIGRKQKRFTRKQMVLRLIPYYAAIGLILFGDIEYYYGPDGAYSYGLMPSAVYFIAAFYTIAVPLSAWYFNKTLQKERLITIFIGTGIWLAAALVQLFVPTLLISGLALVLLIFFFYLSFQNSGALRHSGTGIFNEQAFKFALDECTAVGKPFYVTNILIKDIAELRNLLGEQVSNRMLSELAQELTEQTKENVYYFTDAFRLILHSESEVEQFLRKIQNCFDGKRAENNIKFGFAIALYVLECPRFAKTIQEIQELDVFLNRHVLPTMKNGQAITVNDEIIQKFHRSMAVSGLVADALRHDGLEVFYQPIYDVKAGRFNSAEALVRMKNTGDLGFVSPEEFIPMAEKNGLIGTLGEIVFRKVCSFGRERKLRSRGIKYIEVNLSGIQIVDENICTRLGDIMEQYGTEPSFINLEITETAAVEYKDILQKNMLNFRERGCSFSMDDFGTGYSNISQMAQVQYDLIKLDKSLLWPCFGAEEPEKARMILESFVHLVHKLGVKIVQEGVETKEQFEFLKSLGVEYMQGYYFSRPLNEADYIKFLAEQTMEFCCQTDERHYNS